MYAVRITLDSGSEQFRVVDDASELTAMMEANAPAISMLTFDVKDPNVARVIYQAVNTTPIGPKGSTPSETDKLAKESS